MAPARSTRRLDALAAHTRSALGAARVLDLSEVSWVDPMHLVGIAAQAHLAARQGSRLVLTGLGEGQASYAARMHLGRLINRFGGEHELPTVRERDQQDNLLELCELRTSTDVRRLTALVYQKVAGEDIEVAHALHLALAEVGANVCEHSGTIGFMAAQTIAERGVLRFAVADSGVGLLGTLAARGADDDRVALDMALSGISRTNAPGHGTGLPTTVRIVSGLGGEVLLASGHAAATATADGQLHRSLRIGFEGTLFEGSVPTDRQRLRRVALYGRPSR